MQTTSNTLIFNHKPKIEIKRNVKIYAVSDSQLAEKLDDVEELSFKSYLRCIKQQTIKKH